MVESVKESFVEMIGRSDWMRESSTQEEAQNKMRKAVVKIGYPDQWINLDSLGRDIPNINSYVRKNLAIGEARFQHELERLGRPIDKDHWTLAPTTVNATAEYLSVTFPAALLQPPFYNANADIASNFGAIGAIAAHELVHIGVDREARKVDSKGVFNDWQAESDKNHFDTEIVPKFIQFLNRQTVSIDQEKLHLDAELVLNEYLADVVGLQVAYRAFRQYLIAHPQENTIVNGLTPDQRFFIGYGRLYPAHLTPRVAKTRLEHSSGAPAEIRAEAVRHMEEFHRAFGVRPGDPMYLAPEDRLQFV